MATRKRKTVTISSKKKGQKPMKFQAGALHRALGVPEGQPIPASKKRAALAGRYGKKNQKRANFAYKGALKKGRQTAAKRRRKKRKTGRRKTATKKRKRRKAAKRRK